MNAPSHSGQHTNSNDAIVAIETFVGTTSLPNFAKLTSPHFAGTPTAPTNATATDSSTQLATDAFVQNAVAAYAAPGLRLIYIDELGADPTGVNDSSAVIRAKQTALGSTAYLLIAGAGDYLMSSAFENFGPNQGIVGVGSPHTFFTWSGSGPLINVTNVSFTDSARAGSFGGFSINGPYGSGTTYGVAFGSIQSMILDDVAFYGLPGGAIVGNDTNGGYAEEAQLTRLSISECGAHSGFVFQFQYTSFSYMRIDAVVVVEANIDVLSCITSGNGAVLQGLNLSLRGNCHAGTGANTGAIIAIDRGQSGGNSNIRNATFNVAMEANATAGSTLGHWLLWMGSSNAASQFQAAGVFHLYSAGATCQGGVQVGQAQNAGYVPAAFAGITNATDGTDMYAGNSLAIMGGTGYTTGSLFFGGGAGATVNIYWQYTDVFGCTLSSSGSTFIFNGASNFIRRVELFLQQPATGAAGTVTWPSSVKWPAATPPTLSSVNGYMDKIHFTYLPGTGFWYGELVGVHYG
jgi:hypothetical protein